MSKCAQNMMGKIFALDVKPRGIAIVCLHPGFMKTSMTEIYADKYDELGAIGPEQAAPGIVKVTPQSHASLRALGNAIRSSVLRCPCVTQYQSILFRKFTLSVMTPYSCHR